ncbi:MAG: hypothetical protein EBT08_14695 [Betaproteobacteria bacterium]|nr:hypothetical protein [Betaproteobacteria bacterium]
MLLHSENEFDFDFRSDKTTHSTLLVLSMMTPDQREMVHAFAIELYQLSFGKSARFLGDGTWSGGSNTQQ